MGLYLAVFDEDDEPDGVEVGSYDEFGILRDTIRDELEGGTQGMRFPVLQLHADSDGEWSPNDCIGLERELREIEAELPMLPARSDLMPDWKREMVLRQRGGPRTLIDCFVDVDGASLLQRLRNLCSLAREKRLPILFQ